MIKKSLLVLIVTMGLCSCGSLQKVTKKDEAEQNRDQIVFHDFLARNTGQTVQITEVGREFRDGKVKNNNPTSNDFHHPVEIVFLDKAGKRIQSRFIEHPLISEYEYPNEDGKLGRVTSFKDSASFMLRYNAVQDLNSVRIISIDQDTLVINEDIRIRK